MTAFAAMCSLGLVQDAAADRPRYPTQVAAQVEPQVAGTDRPGADFLTLDLPAPEPAACQDLCRRHRRCKAYTYVHPGVQGAHARCWLKDQVPAARADGCCVSGTIARPALFDPRVLPARANEPVPAGLPAAAPRHIDATPRVVPVLLVVAGTPATRGRLPLTQGLDFYDQQFFGPQEPNVASYFESTSNGRFFFARAGAVGPLDISTQPGTEEHADIVAAVVASGFSFWDYDFDGNGKVDENELVIVAFSNHGTRLGAARRVCRNVGSRSAFENIELCSTGPTASNVAAIGHLGETYNLAHEVMHLLGPTDLYGPGGSGQCWSGNYTLMGCARGGAPHQKIWTHLDAWHKIRLGWAFPRYVSTAAPASTRDLLAPMGADERPLVVFDPARPREFYVLEYRHPDTPDGWDVYDRQSGCPGVIPWYVRLDDTGWPEVPKIVRAGSDGAFQTRVAAGDRTLFDANSVLFIDPWNDGVFQSELVLEQRVNGRITRVGDVMEDQKLLFVGRRPSVVGTRGVGEHHRGLTRRDGVVDLRWMDDSVAVRVSVLSADTMRATVWLGPPGAGPPALPVQSAGGDTQLSRTDFIGCDLDRGMVVADAAACAQMCRAEPRCGAYTFVRATTTCFMKYGAGGRLPNSDCTSGALGGR